MKRRQLATLAAVTLAAAAITAGPALADEYPEKPITLVVPLGAGGSHDLNARVFTSVIPAYLGQAVIVKLMPGASGQTGTAAAASARPDGYTLLFTHNFFDQLQPHVKKLPYDTNKDFKSVVRLNYAVPSIVVRSDSEWQSVDDLIAAAKASPGKIKFGHSGNWGALMVPGAQFMSEAGISLTLVPHKGGGPAMQALLAGDVDFTMAFPSVIGAQGDKLRTLASFGDTRLFDGVPTLEELDYDVDAGLMNRIVLAQTGVPAERMRKLQDAFAKMQEDKTYKRLMKRLGENTDLMMGADYDKVRMKQYDDYGKLVKAITQ